MKYDCHIFSKYRVFQMKSIVFQSKYLVFRSKTLDFGRNTRYFESEISKYQVFQNLNLKCLKFGRNTWYFKKGVKSRVFSGFYVCLLASPSIIPTLRALLSKYQTPALLYQQQKHSTPFIDSFTNPTSESGEVYANRFKLELSFAYKHYVNNSGFHS